MTISKTCLILIPAGTEHGLLSVTNVTTPILNYSGGPNVAYGEGTETPAPPSKS